MVPYPTEVEAFCALYRQLRTSEKPASSAKIHRFHFEDLIYHYDDTVRSILTILGLSESDHLRKKEAFKPEKSINNTQIFRSSPAYFEEAAIIEKRLPEYLYDFPYERQADLSSTF